MIKKILVSEALICAVFSAPLVENDFFIIMNCLTGVYLYGNIAWQFSLRDVDRFCTSGAGLFPSQASQATAARHAAALCAEVFVLLDV